MHCNLTQNHRAPPTILCTVPSDSYSSDDASSHVESNKRQLKASKSSCNIHTSYQEEKEISFNAVVDASRDGKCRNRELLVYI